MVDCLEIHIFIRPPELRVNYPPKHPILKVLNNPMKIFLIQTLFYIVFFH